MTPPLSITVYNSVSAVGEVMLAVEEWCDTAGVDIKVSSRLSIVLDELIANVVSHAAAGQHQVTVALQSEEAAVVAVVSDDAPQFDPLAIPPPDVSLDLDDRMPGGLGIHLARELADELLYSYEDGKNRIAVRLSTDTGTRGPEKD